MSTNNTPLTTTGKHTPAREMDEVFYTLEGFAEKWDKEQHRSAKEPASLASRCRVAMAFLPLVTLGSEVQLQD